MKLLIQENYSPKEVPTSSRLKESKIMHGQSKSSIVISKYSFWKTLFSYAKNSFMLNHIRCNSGQILRTNNTSAPSWVKSLTLSIVLSSKEVRVRLFDSYKNISLSNSKGRFGLFESIIIIVYRGIPKKD